MESVRERHVTPPVEKQAKNSDKIVEDKGGEEGGKTRSSSGRKAKIEGGLMSPRARIRWPLLGSTSPSDSSRRNMMGDQVCGYKTNSGSQERQTVAQFSIYIQVCVAFQHCYSPRGIPRCFH